MRDVRMVVFHFFSRHVIRTMPFVRTAIMICNTGGSGASGVSGGYF